MSSQQIKANFLATGLFVASVCGTFAIFGCVPMLARLTSHQSYKAPAQQQQIFPEVSRRPALPNAADADSPSDRIRRHARAIYPNQHMRQAERSPQPRSSL